jgi:hypothetical protein
MERSIYDIAHFINTSLGSAFKLSNSNSDPISVLVTQDGSLDEINAAKEDHKQNIIALCSDHLQIWIKSEEKSISIFKPVIITSTGRQVALSKHFQRNGILILVVLRWKVVVISNQICFSSNASFSVTNF